MKTLGSSQIIPLPAKFNTRRQWSKINNVSREQKNDPQILYFVKCYGCVNVRGI